MDFKLVRKHWDRLGERDALWAVLSVPAKKNGAWSQEEFFETGRREIDAVLAVAAQRGFDFPKRRALDFGCGVGRLTQALATRFEECDGVDVAPSMVRQATRLNRHANRCRYHLNQEPDLRLFPDGAFDFIYSVLVLQHMEPRFSKRYIREFLRVAGPGALVVFQLPSHRAVAEPAIGAPRSVGTRPLPVASRRAEIALGASEGVLTARSSAVLAATVTNHGDDTWPCLADAAGRYQVTLGSRWLQPDGRTLIEYGQRCPLPFDLRPGESVGLFLGVDAPATNGTYHLELDVVQEHVAWFGEHGPSACRAAFEIVGGAEPAAPLPSAPEAPLPSKTARLRESLPHVYDALVRAGVRDGVRSLRAAWREGGFEIRARTARLRAEIGARVAEPIMEMHCVVRSEVIELLDASGGEVLLVETDTLPGGFQSCRYWVRRPAQG